MAKRDFDDIIYAELAQESSDNMPPNKTVRFKIPKQKLLVVQWLGYMTLTHEIRVQFPAGEPCLERLGSQLAYASGILSRLDIYS